MSFISPGRLTRIFLAFALLLGAIGLQSGSISPYNKHQKAFYAAQSVIDFARPGLVITINSAKIRDVHPDGSRGVASGCSRRDHSGCSLAGLCRVLHPHGSGPICRLYDFVGKRQGVGYNHSPGFRVGQPAHIVG